MADMDPGRGQASATRRPWRAGPPPLTPGLASLTLTLLLGLQPLTTDLMLPALPALADDLGAGTAPVQMTLSALILAFGLAQLFWGPVADRYGRRPVLLSALGLYLLASVAALAADDVRSVIASRAAQGAAMSAMVVCARAMVRDLYQPAEGAMVMARALTGLGLVAIAAPLSGGLLVGQFGWRGPIAAMLVAGLAVGAYVLLRVPESLHHLLRLQAAQGRPQPQLVPQALRPAALWQQALAIQTHPQFIAWTALVACSFGAIFVFISGAGYVFIQAMGQSPFMAGLWLATCPIGYMIGTVLCRRWIPRHGLARSAARAAGFSLAATLALALIGWFEWRQPLVLMAAVWLVSLGHGVNNPCGQTGSVAPFPQSAGLAAALAGFWMALAAFAIGLVLGQVLDGGVQAFAWAMALGTAASSAVALTLVRRLGDPAAAGRTVPSSPVPPPAAAASAARTP